MRAILVKKAIVRLALNTQLTIVSAPATVRNSDNSYQAQVSAGGELVLPNVDVRSNDLSEVLTYPSAKNITLPLGFNAIEPQLSIIGVSTPIQQVNQGDAYTIIISGSGFTGVNSLSCGAGVTVIGYSILTDNVIQASVLVGLTANLGIRDITITKISGSITLNNGLEVIMTKQAINFIAKHNAATGMVMWTLQQSVVNGLYQRLRGAYTTNSSEFIEANLLHRLSGYCPINDTTANTLAYSVDFIGESILFAGFVPGDILPIGVAGGTGKFVNSRLSTLATDPDNHSFGYWYSSVGASTTAQMGVNAGSNYFVQALENNGQYLGNASAFNPASTAAYKSIINSRRGGNDAETYGNGNSIATSATARVALPAIGYEYYYHARNGTGTATLFNVGRFTTFMIGKGLTDNQAKDLHEAVQWYNDNIITGGR